MLYLKVFITFLYPFIVKRHSQSWALAKKLEEIKEKEII